MAPNDVSVISTECTVCIHKVLMSTLYADIIHAMMIVTIFRVMKIVHKTLCGVWYG